MPRRPKPIDEKLLRLARSYRRASKSAGTRRVYALHWRGFEDWCEEQDIQAMPADPDTLAMYITALAEAGQKPATIDLALSAISQAHKLAGHQSPRSDQHVAETREGVRRSLGTAQEQKTAILVEDLQEILGHLPDGLTGVRDRALLTLGFAGAFRRSELVALDVEHVKFVRQGLEVTIVRSKTDQNAQGRKIGIPKGEYGDTCPVEALELWLQHARIKSGPIFRKIDRHGNIGDKALSAQSVALIVKRTVEAAGYDPEMFAGHSLRSGLATSAARARKTERSIARQTGHKSQIVLQRYIRDGTLFEDNAADGIGL